MTQRQAARQTYKKTNQNGQNRAFYALTKCNTLIRTKREREKKNIK